MEDGEWRDAAHRLCRQQNRDFYFATRFLPAAKRDVVCALFAFFGMTADAIASSGLDVTSAAAMRKHPVAASSGCIRAPLPHWGFGNGTRCR